MRQSNEPIAVLAVSVFLVATVSGLIIFNSSFALADVVGHRIEVPPEPPPCPDKFTDTSCRVTGAYGYGWLDLAIGQALQQCDPKYGACVEEQNLEAGKAKQKCEAVEGCVFSEGEPIIENCACTKNNCNPQPGHTDVPYTFYKCEAHGQYDRGGYWCRRPPVSSTQAQITGFINT